VCGLFSYCDHRRSACTHAYPWSLCNTYITHTPGMQYCRHSSCSLQLHTVQRLRLRVDHTIHHHKRYHMRIMAAVTLQRLKKPHCPPQIGGCSCKRLKTRQLQRALPGRPTMQALCAALLRRRLPYKLSLAAATGQHPAAAAASGNHTPDTSTACHPHHQSMVALFEFVPSHHQPQQLDN
jgi:hypothetical protein